MKPKILVLQFRKNTDSKAQEQVCITRELGEEVTVDFIDGFSLAYDWNFPETIMGAYDGLVLGGSGDFDFDGNRPETDEARVMSLEILGRLRPLFAYLFEHDIPTLGICYGHQLLGAFAGAQVVYDERQRKTKSHKVKLLVDKNDYFLFSDLPESFFAQYGHKDVLAEVPRGAVLLMDGGEECQVSVLKYKDNIYTTQFHPELGYDDMVTRMKNNPGYLPEGTVADEVFKQSPESSRILYNFGQFVKTHKETSTEKQVSV